ncbi:hypothetical protein [Ralstonia phage RP31]|uniref:Uncharacterized protein n=2 Tax=Ripduovirus RP12 TaxID=2560700 RepID=A0A1L7N0S6_9CAUD|nr:hypothetical protein FDH28_gp093 [Ralstonia phage RP12]BAW19067.1 hypothetical protein [Ralstonia phage RP12]BAW19352.1 hypothetical protein [Ralstonia phage RP31]
MNPGEQMKRLYLDHVKQLTYDQLNERRRKVDCERTKFFVNRFPDVVYIRDRSGFLTPINPRNESRVFDPDFLFICEQVQCTPETKSEYIRQARSTPNSMRHAQHRAILSNWSGEPPTVERYSVEVMSGLSLMQLMENDGVVYLEEHDIVVMYGLSQQDMERIHHPYSKAGYTYNSFQHISEDNEFLRKGDFTINIRIVDNNDAYGSRWILVEDEPFCIVACKDERVTDGIYITYSKNLLNGTGPQKLMTDRFDLHESDKKLPYKLYGSQQEALLNRRSVQIEEANVRIQELESKATAAENGLLKARQERDNMERDAQLREVRHGQDLEKLQRERAKLIQEHDLYMQKQVGELLSVSRKNTMELIKCVPVVLSAVAATIALFKKK